MTNIFLAVGTWALVLVTWFLVNNTKKQMEENTRNTKEMIKENAKNTQEMIKENVLLSWRNNVIASAAELIGHLDHVKSFSTLKDTSVYDHLRISFTENEKLILLLRIKWSNIGDDLNEMIKNVREIFNERAKTPTDEKKIDKLTQEYNEKHKSFRRRLDQLLYETE